MVARCHNPKSPDFSRYGGRGIAVCDRWRVFANFKKDMGDRPEGMTLDRIDNAKGYNPENCRWATWAQQANNRDVQARQVTYGGRSQSIADWANEIGLPVSTLRNRIKRGWPMARALGAQLSESSAMFPEIIE